MSHGDLVTKHRLISMSLLPARLPIASIQNAERKMYGIQFHAEVRHSEYGNDLLRHFTLDVCNVLVTGQWKLHRHGDRKNS
nr:hypothetical protein [Enterococcus faecium]